MLKCRETLLHFFSLKLYSAEIVASTCTERISSEGLDPHFCDTANVIHKHYFLLYDLLVQYKTYEDKEASNKHVIHINNSKVRSVQYWQYVKSTTWQEWRHTMYKCIFFNPLQVLTYHYIENCIPDSSDVELNLPNILQ